EAPSRQDAVGRDPHPARGHERRGEDGVPSPRKGRGREDGETQEPAPEKEGAARRPRMDRHGMGPAAEHRLGLGGGGGPDGMRARRERSVERRREGEERQEAEGQQAEQGEGGQGRQPEAALRRSRGEDDGGGSEGDGGRGGGGQGAAGAE